MTLFKIKMLPPYLGFEGSFLPKLSRYVVLIYPTEGGNNALPFMNTVYEKNNNAVFVI